jgi:hypothetical protein
MGPVLNSLLILCTILTAYQSPHLVSGTKKGAKNFIPVSPLILQGRKSEHATLL